MTGVIYARYSSDHQREESIEGQIRECEAYAKKNGIRVLKVYTDRAFSGKSDNRPDFQKMITESHRKLFDVIIVWKLDRFSRDRIDFNYQKGTKTVTFKELEEVSEGSSDLIVSARPKLQI